MKRFLRVFSLILICILIVALLCGCQNAKQEMQVKVQELAGTWSVTIDHSEAQARTLLENIDLYEEEIALVDLSALDYVKLAEFDTNLQYRFYCDPEGTKACVRTFFQKVFADLYENRSALNVSYGRSFEGMSETEFRQFYTSLYGKMSFDALITHFVDTAFDYIALAEPMDIGTYTIDDTFLLCTNTKAEETGAITYTLNKDGTLTLRFSNATEIYRRIK